MVKNRTVQWDGDTVKVIQHDPLPLQPGEARIRLRLAGICNTDLELIAGYKDFRGRLGHEFVGEVAEGAPEWIGQRVVGEINIVCGTCDMCRRGWRSQCRNRAALGIEGGAVDGAFADTFRLLLENLHVVPDSVPDEAAVFTEPLAAACRIPELNSFQSGDRVVLIGAGKLGMLCAQVMQQADVDLTVIYRRDKQRDLLDKWSIHAAKREEVPDGMADYVIDCTGQVDGFNAALAIVRPRGTIILKSTVAGLTPANLTDVAVREIRIVGSRCGPFPDALSMLERQEVDVQSMIEETYALDDAPQALEFAALRGILKVLLRP